MVIAAMKLKDAYSLVGFSSYDGEFRLPLRFGLRPQGPCRVMGHQWPAAGAGALGEVDLGVAYDAFELWCWRRLLRVLGLQGDQTSQS